MKVITNLKQRVKVLQAIAAILSGGIVAVTVVGSVELWTKILIETHNSRPNTVVKIDEKDYSVLYLGGVLFNSFCLIGWAFKKEDE